MRMRLGFMVGFAAGYVLGSKAGTERYHQIVGMAQKAMGTEPVQQLQDEVRVVAERVGEKTAESVHKVSEKVLPHEHTPTTAGNGATTPATGTSGIDLTETSAPPTA